MRLMVYKIVFLGTRETVGEMNGIENYIPWKKRDSW